MNKNYIIKYGMCLNDDGYKSGKIKVKNCMSEIHSKIKLEEYLKRKNTDFKNMVVYSCYEDYMSQISDLLEGL